MFLHVFDYIIAFMWQSCCGERAGINITIKTSKGRIDKRLAGEGHKTGTTKEGMGVDRGESSSKVVRRHLEQKTNTFPLKK